MAQVSITAVPRSDFGKGAARRTRREGLVPAVVYGQGKEPQHVSLPTHDLTLALRHPGLVLEVTIEGKKILVAPRDVQRDPVRRILEHIPRLEGVVAILDSYRDSFDARGLDGPPPLGARVLRLAVDFDALEAHGADPAVVIASMRGRKHEYDPRLMDAFARLTCDPHDLRRVKQIPLLGLRAGMMLADDVRASNGNLLIARGHTATEQLVTRLWNLTASAVREPLMVIDEA